MVELFAGGENVRNLPVALQHFIKADMKPIWHRNFRDWHLEEVMYSFGLERVIDSPSLGSWVSAVASVPPFTDELLAYLRRDLIRGTSRWNETELMMRFVGPLLAAVGFDGAGFSLFHNRSLGAQFDAERTVSGAVDGVVASGLLEPEQPYFFIHEYKRSYGNEADPLGQLLVAMLAAQHRNSAPQPLYGCYIVGRIWSFVLLEGRQFAESQGYDATDASELRIIWSVLRETRRRIELLAAHSSAGGASG
jgi:hypothetical protein